MKKEYILSSVVEHLLKEKELSVEEALQLFFDDFRIEDEDSFFRYITMEDETPFDIEIEIEISEEALRELEDILNSFYELYPNLTLHDAPNLIMNWAIKEGVGEAATPIDDTKMLEQVNIIAQYMDKNRHELQGMCDHLHIYGHVDYEISDIMIYAAEHIMRNKGSFFDMVIN